MYLKDTGHYNTENDIKPGTWPSRIDNALVEVTESLRGDCKFGNMTFGVLPEWCKVLTKEDARMKKCFYGNKRYRFRKEILISRLGSANEAHWQDLVDGQEIVIVDRYNGYVNEGHTKLTIRPEWCEEVQDE